MVNQILRKNNHIVLVRIAFCCALFFIFSIAVADARYTGDDADQKAIERYIRAHIDDYFRDLNTVNNRQKRRVIIELRREIESLALKIDAGDIRNISFRQKVITIRSNASKKSQSNQLVVHNFDRMNNNRLGGRPISEYAGVIGSISPWIDIAVVNEEGRLGKKMLQAEYDVTEGEVSIIVPVRYAHYFKRYNEIRCKIKGDLHSIRIGLKFRDGQIESQVVADIGKAWNHISFPIDDLGEDGSFDTADVTGIYFTLDRSLVHAARGSFYLDELALGRRSDRSASVKKKTSFVYEVEGTVPLGTNKSFFPRE